MEQNGTLTGFSVDLWNAIAARLKLKTSYQIVPDVSHLEEAMRSKNADITIGLFITSARDETFDFSIPTLQAGLQIMVRRYAARRRRPASPLWDHAPSAVFANDRSVARHGPAARPDPGSSCLAVRTAATRTACISSQNYFPGIFEAIYWAISTADVTGADMPHQWVARVISQSSGCSSGVVFVAFYTAQLTDDPDRRADSRRYRGSGRLARQADRDGGGQHRGRLSSGAERTGAGVRDA